MLINIDGFYDPLLNGIVQNMDWTGLDWTGLGWTGLDSWTGLILIYIFKCFAPQSFHSRRFYVQIFTFADDLNYNWSEIPKPKRTHNLWFKMKSTHKKQYKIVDFFNENYLSLLLSLQIDNSTETAIQYKV